MDDLLDLVYFVFFDKTFWQRQATMSPGLIKRMSLRIFMMTQRHFNQENVQGPPILRAIATYGRMPISRQVASFLKEPLEGNLILGPDSFIRSVVPFISCLHLIDPKIGKPLVECGVYRALMKKIWVVVGSDLGDDDIQPALYYSLSSLTW